MGFGNLEGGYGEDDELGRNSISIRECRSKYIQVKAGDKKIGGVGNGLFFRGGCEVDVTGRKISRLSNERGEGDIVLFWMSIGGSDIF